MDEFRPFHPQFPCTCDIPRRDRREGRENREVLVLEKRQLIFVQRVHAQPNADRIQIDLGLVIGPPFLGVEIIDEFVIRNGHEPLCCQEQIDEM
jgi:hypothetical protein